ncbi:MAG: fibronectin type III domain-containing protein [Nocardioides sp.]
MSDLLTPTLGFRRRWLAALTACATALTLAYALPIVATAAAPVGASRVGVLGAGLASSDDSVDTLSDTFNRSDRDAAGDMAPTGHVYSTQNPDSVFIVGGRLKFAIPFGKTAILYSPLSRNVDSCSVRWRFTDELQHQNIVSGVGPVSFGNASMQLASYASPSVDVNLGRGLTWLLFLVFDSPGPATAEYIALASNHTHGDLLAPAALDTEYTQGWRFISDDTVEVTLLDGTTRTITDPRLATIRGTQVGTQKRQASADTADLEVLSVTASSLPAAPQPFAGYGLAFDGTANNYAQTAQPTLTSPNLDVTISVADWAAGRTDRLLSIFGGTGNGKFHVGRTSANATALGVSVRGATTVATTGSTAIPVGTKFLRITRVASTGTITFWTASSDAARFLPTTDPAWTVWRTRTNATDGVPIGALDPSNAPLRIGYAIGPEPWFNGTVRYVNVRDGLNGRVVAERDFLSTAVQAKTDATGNTWQIIGEAWQWAAIPTVPGPVSVTGSTPSAGAVSVAFNPPKNNGGSPITGYTVQCVSTDGGGTGTRSGSGSPIRVTGLSAGKRYHCRVKATNAVGDSLFSGFGSTVVVRMSVHR